MLGKTRTLRFAILGFTLVAALVLSGLAWATVASLHLERATHARRTVEHDAQVQSVLHKNLQIARLELERIILPVLLHEVSRDYKEYAPKIHNESGLGDERIDSPLRAGGPEFWIPLHFQVTEDACWTSPQLSLDERREYWIARPWEGDGPSRITCAEADASDPESVARHELLKQLALSYTPEDFADRIAATGQSPTARLQRPFLPPKQECEPVRQVRRVTGTAPFGEDDAISVDANEMAAMALPLPGDESSKVALVRQVDTGAQRVFQGLIIDLPELAAVLESRVAEVFDHVELRPVSAAYDPQQPNTQLGLLPVRLIVPRPQSHAASSDSTAVRMTVAFAWVSALVALAAVGWGVKRLVTLSERRREFTYAVTHELRTPLTTFQLYTDMLASGLVPNEKKAFYLDTLNQESRRLSELVSEVLEFSRIESNALHPRLSDHAIGELMSAVRERHVDRCRRAGLDLCIDANGVGDRPVHTDPEIALQILGTLIDNACKYATAPNAGPSPGAAAGATNGTLQLRVLERPAALAIEVADNGPGIPPRDRRHLFKPFRRGSQSGGARTGGVGLGLALAKRWTRLIGGRIELCHRPERPGACFRLTLPVSGAL